MIRFHLVVNIYNDFFTGNLGNGGKIDSVWFEDYDIIIEKMFHDMSIKEINKFKLNLFNIFRDQLGYCRVSKFDDGETYDGYMIPRYTFNVTSHQIACAIPNRKIRDKYFDYDLLRERYYIRSDFIYWLKL